MEQYQLAMVYNGLFTSSALFAAVFIFLLWMMFRGANIAKENGANLIQKILSTVASLCVIVFNLNIWNTNFANINNYAYALSQLDDLSPGAQAFVGSMGATEAVSPSLIPSDPFTAVFWAIMTFSLLATIWTAPTPK